MTIPERSGGIAEKVFENIMVVDFPWECNLHNTDSRKSNRFQAE